MSTSNALTPVTPTATPTPTSSATSATSNGATSNGILNFTQNFDTFLTLLTTQLKNQDPLDPTDSSQFTQQLVMFSEVEQQIKTNSELSTMISGQNAGEAIQALPLIGQTIEYSGNQTVLQNGQAGFSYTLPTSASQASIVIQDSNGATVFSTPAATTAGQHSFLWNGQTSTGTQEPDGGTYTMQVLATGANNATITATTAAVGTVTGVSVTNNVATFNVSGIQVPMTQLITIVNSNSSSTSAN
jgi:flagellar basal-body rod modification protein FlgD